MEDLQLGVKSYQKKLNLTKPDTYRSDLKRKEAYFAYSNPRGFIYHNKDKKNRLMQIDELHKFSDGTLTDVHTALDDRLKGIRMQYLPQSILTDLQVTPTKPRRMTKPYSSHQFIANCFNAGNLKMAVKSSPGPALNEMTPTTISSGLVQKPSSSTPYVPPSRNDWDLLFQPMFDELLNPPPTVNPQAPKVIAPIADLIPPVHVELTETQSAVIPQDVKEDIHDIELAHTRNDPLVGVPTLEVISAQSSSNASPHTIVQSDHQIPQHNSKWTKDHPLDNIIDQLSRPVSTRLQLHEQARFCYYDAFLTLVEPKTY
nr:hypothetical protein [Tanacetum cinerariifolium]